MTKRPAPRRAARLDEEQVRDIYRRWTEEINARALPHMVAIFENVTGKKVGADGMAGCPFHDDRSPSMSVTNGKGFACHAPGCSGNPGGLPVRFMQLIRGDFKAARNELAALVGLSPPDFKGYHFKPRPEGSRIAGLKPAVHEDQLPEMVIPIKEIDESSLMVVPPHFKRPAPANSFRIFSPDEDGGKVQVWRPSMCHEYREPDGSLKAVVLRIDGKDRKTFRQIHCGRVDPATPEDLHTNGWGWVKGLPGKRERKPVYGAERIREWLRIPEQSRGGILVVEGEKCVDYANRSLNDPRVLVVSPMGGSNGALYADWRPLIKEMISAGTSTFRLFAWPDADNSTVRKSGLVIDPREIFMKRVVAGFSRDIEATSLLLGMPAPAMIPLGVNAPADKGSGWDIADAIDEGWGKKMIAEHIRENSFRVDPEEEIKRRYAEKEPENGPSHVKEEADNEREGPA